MFIEIICTRSGETEMLRRLAPNESIDPAYHVQHWAKSIGVRVADSTGHIPSGCGDFYAETRDTKEASGVCWSSFDFYLTSDDDA